MTNTGTNPFEDSAPKEPDVGPTPGVGGAAEGGSKSKEPAAASPTATTQPDAPISPVAASPAYAPTEPATTAEPVFSSPTQSPPDHDTVTEPTPTLPTRPDTQPTQDTPEVESLKAMFPDFDSTILQSVLESVGGDQERAADVLLGMSDPNYVSQEVNMPSQSELDEQLARRLLAEEQQQAAWHPDQQYPHQQERQRANVPYEARTQGGRPQQQGQYNANAQGAPGGKDTMAEVQEQFSKIAETGKKTFSSLMGKVKAKMQEFDQSRSSSSTPQQTSWGSGTPSGAPPGSQRPPSSSSQPQPQYYEPGPGPDGHGHFQPQGYDAAPPHAQSAFAGGTGAGNGLGAGSPTSERDITISPPPPVTAPRPPSGPPPASVDPTKIGMLPKRPVSLLGSTPPQSSNAAHHDDDDDELDYVENPFEEGRR